MSIGTMLLALQGVVSSLVGDSRLYELFIATRWKCYAILNLHSYRIEAIEKKCC